MDGLRGRCLLPLQGQDGLGEEVKRSVALGDPVVEWRSCLVDARMTDLAQALTTMSADGWNVHTILKCSDENMHEVIAWRHQP